MSIVSATGTLVKSDSTSNEERSPVGLVVCKIERKSSVEFIWDLVGRYGVIMLFYCLAVSQVGVVIWDIIGLRGLLGLWIFTVPYRYSGLYSPVIGFMMYCLLPRLTFLINLFTSIFSSLMGLRVIPMNFCVSDRIRSSFCLCSFFVQDDKHVRFVGFPNNNIWMVFQLFGG